MVCICKFNSVSTTRCVYLHVGIGMLHYTAIVLPFALNNGLTHHNTVPTTIYNCSIGINFTQLCTLGSGKHVLVNCRFQEIPPVHLGQCKSGLWIRD